MKKLFKQFKVWIISKIDNFTVNRFKLISPAYSALITELYRKVAKDNLNITTEIIEVKKGEVRYKLLVIKDKNLKTVYNLGRYYSDAPTLSKADNYEKSK
jgi:hypothetical protein